MTADERRTIRLAINRNMRDRLLPVETRRCPVHHRLVAIDGDGHLLGRCDGCTEEAAAALTLIQGAAA